MSWFSRLIGNVSQQPLASRPPSAQRRHVRLDPGFIEKNQPARTETVPVCIITADHDAEALLAELDENLARGELSPLEYGLHIRAREDAFLVLKGIQYGRTFENLKALSDFENLKRGKEAPKGQNGSSDEETPESFIADTAAKTGKSEKTIKRAKSRAKVQGVEKLLKTAAAEDGQTLDALVTIQNELGKDEAAEVVDGLKADLDEAEKEKDEALEAAEEAARKAKALEAAKAEADKIEAAKAEAAKKEEEAKEASKKPKRILKDLQNKAAEVKEGKPKVSATLREFQEQCKVLAETVKNLNPEAFKKVRSKLLQLIGEARSMERAKQ